MSKKENNTNSKHTSGSALRRRGGSSDRRTYGDYLPEYDIVLFNGGIEPGVSREFSGAISAQCVKKKKKVLVLAATRGGSADEAFKMMKLLQRRYERVELVLMGGCFSAGTLFATGADVIYMSENATLGPLDVQIPKEDDWTRMSGECYRQALVEMSEMARCMFSTHFTALKTRRDILISTSTASRVATDMTIGLLAPITAQIEPGRLGEVMRTQRIGAAYARRLMMRVYSPSVGNKIANRLAMGYPSHSTVIDVEEAKDIGLNVCYFDPRLGFSGVFSGLANYMYDQRRTTAIVVLNEQEIKGEK